MSRLQSDAVSGLWRFCQKDENAVICVASISTAVRFRERLGYFVGKGQMDIENLGPV